MSYADLTINDPNPVKRFFQRQRFTTALSLLPKGEDLSILDYGTGDGELVLRMRQKGIGFPCTCFDPAPEMIAQAREKLCDMDGVDFVEDIAALKNDTQDVIFCLEVFEHLPSQLIEDALKEMRRVLKPGGRLIVGVPVEIGLPALYKGIFRMLRRKGEFDAQIENVLSCLFFVPPTERPSAWITPTLPYYPLHCGFDHRKLIRETGDSFRLVKRKGSPLGFMKGFVNPEIFLVFELDPENDKN